MSCLAEKRGLFVCNGAYVPTRSNFVQRIRHLVREDVELEIGRDQVSNFDRY